MSRNRATGMHRRKDEVRQNTQRKLQVARTTRENVFLEFVSFLASALPRKIASSLRKNAVSFEEREQGGVNCGRLFERGHVSRPGNWHELRAGNLAGEGLHFREG